MVIALAVHTLLIAVAAAGAFLRGGSTERRGLAIFIAGALSRLAAGSLQAEPTRGAWLFLIDLVLLAALVQLSWRSPRPWPAWACGFQLLALAAGVAGWIGPDLDRDLVLALVSGCGAAAVAALSVGTWLPAKAR